MKEFTKGALPGPYFRVITPGHLQAGDAVEVLERPDHDVTVSLAFRAMTLEPALLPRFSMRRPCRLPTRLWCGGGCSSRAAQALMCWSLAGRPST